MKPQYCILVALVFGLAACNQSAPQVNTPKILGVLEVAFNDNTIGASKFIPAKLGSQALINENEITFTPAAGIGGTSLSVEANAPRSFDYVSRIFTITNKAGGTGTINNLTLVALAQTGNVAPTTAIKTITNFNGNALTAATAQAARPTHRMTGNGTVGMDTTEPYRASFQAFTSSEVTAMQGQLAALSYSGTVLEYGFVASSTGATASRTLADGVSANVALAMRFPAGGGAGVYNFVMTFVVLEGGATRVTRSPEESTANANTRAGNVTTSPATTVTKVLIDDPAVNITADYTVQNNLKIGTGASQTLLKPAKLVLARVSAGGGYAGTPFVYNSDFVEIFNAGELSASLNGMTLQIANLSVELGATGIVDVSALGILSPGQYKLVSTTSKNTNDTTVTPASEIATIWNVNFNFANAVRVALVNQTTALGCGGVTVNGTASVVCTSTQNSKIVDLLAYKKATSTVVLVQYEGTTFFSFPTDSGELAFSRKDKGCLDVNQNSTDFFVETLNLIPPNPIVSARNGSTTPFICP